MKRKEYSFQDGMAGMVVAKSLNQAINILTKNTDYTKQEIRKGIKAYENNDEWSSWYMDTWYYDCYPTKKKTGFYGYCE